MGAFSIDIHKLPVHNELPVIQQQVWFPNLTSPSERSRVLNHPGIDQRLTEIRNTVDADATIFELNKTIKGRYTTVASSRPGILARTDEASFDVHLPVRLRSFDLGSIALQPVEFDPGFAAMYEEECESNLGQLAVARAIKVACLYGVASRVINLGEHK